MSFRLPRRAKTRQVDRGGASAEIKSKAAEMAGEEVGDLLTFSKASFRMRLNEAPAGIGRGDGYPIWPTRDETWAWSNFKVLPAVLGDLWLGHIYERLATVYSFHSTFILMPHIISTSLLNPFTVA